MKATFFLFFCLFFSNTILAQVTTCDMLADNAVVTVDETTNPIRFRTHYLDPDLVFIEEVESKKPRQITIMINGQQVFIDAMVYTTSFGSEVILFEVAGQTRGFYGMFPGNSTPLELTNCTVQ